MKTLNIVTSRLAIEKLSLDDAPFILKLLNDPGFLKFIGDRGVRNLQEAETYIAEGPLASYDRHGFGLFLTSLREGEIPIGICGFLQRHYLEAPDIGFAFLEKFCGQGHAYEAASAMMGYGQQTLNLDPILAITSPYNVRSIGLLNKLGLRFEKRITIPGEKKETLLFST